MHHHDTNKHKQYYDSLAALALRGLGALALERRNVALARSQLEEGLAMVKELEYRRGIALFLQDLGSVAAGEDEEDAAKAFFRESLEIHHALGDRHGVACVLEGFAGLASREEPERAARLWGAAEALREAIGAPLVLAERSRNEREVAPVRKVLEGPGFEAAWTEGRKLSPGEAVAFALGRGVADAE